MTRIPIPQAETIAATAMAHADRLIARNQRDGHLCRNMEELKAEIAAILLATPLDERNKAR